jgi:NO-binding membrane sensor protein with MHYT domain
MRVVSCLFTEHNLWLVALAAVVCVSGSAIALGLYARARERTDQQKLGWIFLTAVAAGSSIWCTHFIAMLAYVVEAPVTFDPILTMASLELAIVGCGAGFGLSAYDSKKFPPEVCGAVVGISVALMHYTGMAAYHVSGLVTWNTGYIVASVAIAAVLAALALREAVRQPRQKSDVIAIALFVTAIVGLHFTGMAAVEVVPMAGLEMTSNKDVMAAIAVAVAGVGLMVIGTGVASYLIDARVSADAFERLQHMALNDALTGLPNRVHLTDYGRGDRDRPQPLQGDQRSARPRRGRQGAEDHCGTACGPARARRVRGARGRR